MYETYVPGITISSISVVSTAQRRVASRKAAATHAHARSPFPGAEHRVCLSAFRDLATCQSPLVVAASLYLVSRVWKTLNGFLMTRRNRGDARWMLKEREDEEQTHRRRPPRGGKQQLIHTHTHARTHTRPSFWRSSHTTDDDGDYRLVKRGKATVPAFHARFRTRFFRFSLDSLSTPRASRVFSLNLQREMFHARFREKQKKKL